VQGGGLTFKSYFRRSDRAGVCPVRLQEPGSSNSFGQPPSRGERGRVGVPADDGPWTIGELEKTPTPSPAGRHVVSGAAPSTPLAIRSATEIYSHRRSNSPVPTFWSLAKSAYESDTSATGELVLRLALNDLNAFRTPPPVKKKSASERTRVITQHSILWHVLVFFPREWRSHFQAKTRKCPLLQ